MYGGANEARSRVRNTARSDPKLTGATMLGTLRLHVAWLGGHTALEIRKLELELELGFINHSCEWELIFRSLRPSISPNIS